jgi:hypothetical protein
MNQFTSQTELDPTWLKLVGQAVELLPHDPDSCVLKLTALGERIARDIALRERLQTEERGKLIELLEELEAQHLLDSAAARSLHTLRQKGNQARHQHNSSSADARAALGAAHAILEWYERRYIRRRPPHEIPEERTGRSEPEALEGEYVEDKFATSIILSQRSAQAVFVLAAHAIALGSQVGKTFEQTAQSLLRAKANILAAEAPFKLGVIGDSNAGKSTLINALCGDLLAFTSALEATAVPCCFKTGTNRGATVYFRDGTSEQHTVEQANAFLEDKRDEKAWITSVDHLAFTTTSPALGELELWDAPGFGGSDLNDVTAGEFLERIGGAVFVFDYQFLGAAQHLAPLRLLQHACKKVLGVLNKVDLLEEEHHRLALEEAIKRYGSCVEDWALISAKEAFERTRNGRSDAVLDSLLAKLHHTVLDSAASDRQARIRAAIQNSARDLAMEIEDEQQLISAQLGFIVHVERNLQLAYQHVLDQLDDLIRRACWHIFAPHAERARVELAKLYSADPPLGSRELDARFEETMLRLEVNTPLPEAYRAVSQAVLRELNELWDRECLDAIRLSSAAVPELSNSFHPTRSPGTPAENNGGWNFAHALGVLLGGVAVAALHLPLVMAAVPVLLMQGWKLFVPSGEPATSSLGERQVLIESYVSEKRGSLEREATNQMRSDLKSLLGGEVQRLRANCVEAVFGAVDLGDAQRINRKLRGIRTQLVEIAGDGMRWDHLQSRPLPITPDDAGAALWVRLLSTPSKRLDLLTPTIDASLVGLLSGLRPGVQVRLITTSQSDSRDILWPLEHWHGAWSATIVRTPDKRMLDLQETLLILDGTAVVSSSHLGDISHETVLFNDFPEGSLAAQRFFAEVLEARCSRFGPMISTRHSQAARGGPHRLESESHQ